MDLEEVQKAQKAFDEKFWAHKAGFDTIRHSSHHLGKLIGKLATYCEAMEHNEQPPATQLEQEVIPDLLIFAARLANDRGLELEAAFKQRTAELTERFS